MRISKSERKRQKTEVSVSLLGIMHDKYLHSLDGSHTIRVVGLSKGTLESFDGFKAKASGRLYFIGKSLVPRLKLKTFSAA